MDSDTYQSLMKQLDTIEEQSERHMNRVSEAHHLFFIDVHINCSAFILPGHKYVLSARSDILREQFQSGVNELDWTDYEPEIGLALLKWLYTDTVVFENDTIALGLLRASYHFQLHTLFEACECMLLKSVTEERAHEFHRTAVEVGSNKLAEVCMRRPIRCDNTPPPTPATIAIKRNHSIDPDLHTLLTTHRKLTCQREQEIFNRLKMLAAWQDKISKMSGGLLEYVKCGDVNARGAEDWVLHSYVLIARSEKSREEILSNKDISWYKFSKDCIRALLRWLYTDVISLDSENLALDLMKAAHEYKLSSLFELCEQMLIKTVNLTTTAKVHRVAKDVGAVTLLKHCTRIVCRYWDGLRSQELSKLSEKFMDYEIQMYGDFEGSLTEMTTCEHDLSSLENKPEGLLMLNDDCLFHLLRYTTLVDLGSLKDTCQRLNQLVDQSFKIYGQKLLTIDHSSVIADLWILKHFGKFLNSLTINGCYPDYASFEDIFAMIGKFCNVKLKTIHFYLGYDENVSDESLKCLEKIMKNVEVIKFDGFVHDRQIDLLLSYCENLKDVCFEGDEMEINTIWCTKNCNVKHITLNGLNNDDILKEISETMPDLEHLVLNVIETDINNINYLTRLNHLKHLHIGSYYENIWNFLQNLSKKNLLEHLSISYLDVDELVAYAIGQFTKLKDLSFSHIDSRIDEYILHILSKQLNNIEKLSFVECEEITFGDITMIIKNNLKLKELVIYDCGNIDLVDRENYLLLRKLRKRRNLQIYLNKSVYESSIKLIANDLSQYVQLVAKPSKRN